METQADKLFGYENGAMVAIARHVGGDCWTVWHCRSVGHRSAALDTVGCIGARSARQYIKSELRADRVVMRRGARQQPGQPLPIGLMGGTPERDAEHWKFVARNCGLMD